MGPHWDSRHQDLRLCTPGSGTLLGSQTLGPWALALWGPARETAPCCTSAIPMG